MSIPSEPAPKSLASVVAKAFSPPALTLAKVQNSRIGERKTSRVAAVADKKVRFEQGARHYTIEGKESFILS
jgi:hypothetical protein